MIPQEIRQEMHFMMIAKMYNFKTGATITHSDVKEWGFGEALRIESALKFMGDLKDG